MPMRAELGCRNEGMSSYTCSVAPLLNGRFRAHVYYRSGSNSADRSVRCPAVNNIPGTADRPRRQTLPAWALPQSPAENASSRDEASIAPCLCRYRPAILTAQSQNRGFIPNSLCAISFDIARVLAVLSARMKSGLFRILEM